MFGSTTTGGGSLQPGFNNSSTGTSFGGMTGSSLFGNTQKPAGGLFGGGAQQTAQPTGSLFGTASQAPTAGGGVFGGFGSTTTAPQTTSIFGATQPAAQPSSLFGGGGTNMLQTNTAAPTSLFGNTQRPAGGLFGGGAQQTAQPTGSLFGATSQAPTTGGGLFGGFGSTTGATQATSIFGATQPAAQPSSLFGASQATGTMIKFDPLKASDTMLMGGVPKPIQTKHMCISAMKQYEAKSLEELRVEDYLANRKTGTGGMTGSSLFSNTQKPAGGLFTGGAQQTAQPTSSIFGTTSQAQTAGGGVFGGFGSTTTAPQATSIFGAKPTAQQPTSIFSGGGTNLLPTNTAAPTSIFGNTQKPAGGLFGGGAQQTAQPTSSLFNTASQAPTAGGGVFGGFGSTTTAPQTTSIFGHKPAQQTSIFGGATTTFPSSQPTAPATSSAFPSFGNAPPLFGSAQQTAPAATAGFGSTQMYGAVAAPPMNMGNIQHAIIEAQLNALPYGDSPLLKMSTPLQGSGEKKSSDSSSVTRRVSSVTSTSTARAASTPSTKQTPPSAKVPVAGVSLNTSALNASFTYKPLVSLPYAGFGAPLSLGKSPSVTGRPSNVSANDSTSLRSSSFLSQASREGGEKGSAYRPTSTLKAKAFDVSVLRKHPSRKQSFEVTPKLAETAQGNGSIRAQSKESETRASDESAQLETSRQEGQVHQASAKKSSPKTTSGVVDEKEALRPEYYYRPSLDTLRESFHDGVAKIDEGLTIGRLGYGSVFWRGPFEIHDVDSLQDVVHFRAREAVVYPDESKKPERGEELNRPAEVSLERIWPISKETREPIKDSDEIRRLGFRAKLEKTCELFAGTFKDYNPATGTWTFEVPHF